MKLHPDSVSATTISSYGPGWIGIGGERVAASVVVGSQGQRFAWNCLDFNQLGPDHFAQLAAMGTELVIFGSGLRLRFPQAAWLQPLIERRIGIETMDTQAACRTYNILVAEGRSVAAALLIDRGEG
ncbi:Mth938-like domain-containing protein [Rhodoferax sp.]|uniref:Mth938-like domain-containing protein n=1 Tax=Rhodoferax sp. TaxID=50421 RepID=UPI00275BC14D|nr:Mth938-like domain-containing protein [Rhodoferax sp.]